MNPVTAPTILGLSAGLYTGIHVVLSLIGILSGFLLFFFLIGKKRHTYWTSIFFLSNILTDVTGFLFPFKSITPGIIIGVLSLVALLVAIVALLSKTQRGAFISASAVALFFNVFVLIVQSFEKISWLHNVAPTQTSPVFWIAQAVGLGIVILVAVTAWGRYRKA
jgi:hypothetical protein